VKLPIRRFAPAGACGIGVVRINLAAKSPGISGRDLAVSWETNGGV